LNLNVVFVKHTEDAHQEDIYRRNVFNSPTHLVQPLSRIFVVKSEDITRVRDLLFEGRSSYVGGFGERVNSKEESVGAYTFEPTLVEKEVGTVDLVLNINELKM